MVGALSRHQNGIINDLPTKVNAGVSCEALDGIAADLMGRGFICSCERSDDALKFACVSTSTSDPMCSPDGGCVEHKRFSVLAPLNGGEGTIEMCVEHGVAAPVVVLEGKELCFTLSIVDPFMENGSPVLIRGCDGTVNATLCRGCVPCDGAEGFELDCGFELTGQCTRIVGDSLHTIIDTVPKFVDHWSSDGDLVKDEKEDEQRPNIFAIPGSPGEMEGTDSDGRVGGIGQSSPQLNIKVKEREGSNLEYFRGNNFTETHIKVVPIEGELKPSQGSNSITSLVPIAVLMLVSAFALIVVESMKHSDDDGRDRR